HANYYGFDNVQLDVGGPSSGLVRPIRVENPIDLPASEIPAERIALGSAYKPSMALLPNNELVLMAFRWEGPYQPGAYHEYNVMRRSSDFGRTWSDWTRVEATPGSDLIGREH